MFSNLKNNPRKSIKYLLKTLSKINFPQISLCYFSEQALYNLLLETVN